MRKRCTHCGSELASGATTCSACSRPLAAPDDPYVGKILLGKYRCLELAGVGETSRVYKVQHPKLARFRALKILRADLAARPQAIEAFWREMRVASSLRSLNVATLHDVDALPDATPCATFELIDGPSLAARVAKAPLGALAATLARGLLGALEALHAQGLAHLDLCPENVLLETTDGNVQALLVDFGEARKFGASPERALEEPKLGFAAPEQLYGESVDARADVFAIGALLCFAYTGHPPLASQNASEYAAELRRFDPAGLRGLEPLPPPLRLVVQRCLAPDPKDRLADAEAVRDAIHRAARGPGSPEPTQSTVARALPSLAKAPPAVEPEPHAPAPAREPPGSRAKAPSAYLEVVAGWKRAPIPVVELLTLGRSEASGVYVDHPTVSKQHARIRHDGASFIFEDLNSRNGSSINGKRVGFPTPLKDGDTLILGEVVFRFRESAG